MKKKDKIVKALKEQNIEVPKELMLSTHEFADIASVTPITIIEWCKKGKIKYKKTLGGHRRIPISEVKKINSPCKIETHNTGKIIKTNKKTKYPISQYKKIKNN